MSEINTTTVQKSFAISPLSPLGLLLGCIIQTFYGWHQPVDALDMLWMGFHIFLQPTIMVLVVFGAILLIPLVISCLVMLLRLVLSLFRKV